jgi:hypothetical protein
LANVNTHLRVLTPEANDIAVYDCYRAESEGAEFERFCAKFGHHRDFSLIQDKVAQLLNPKRLPTLPADTGPISAPHEINENFFRPETPQRDFDGEFAGRDNIVAIPGKEKNLAPTLRLVCFQWDRRTVVIVNGYDKLHKGRTQEARRTWEPFCSMLHVFRAILLAVEEKLLYTINKSLTGFVKMNETRLCERVELQKCYEEALSRSAKTPSAEKNLNR